MALIHPIGICTITTLQDGELFDFDDLFFADSEAGAAEEMVVDDSVVDSDDVSRSVGGTLVGLVGWY